MVRNFFFVFSSCCLFVLGGCWNEDLSKDVVPESQAERRYDNVGYLFGPNALTFQLGKGGKEDTSPIRVNTYLWRGTLKTLAFMPIQSADPFGGVILTDWYVPPANPKQRFKVTVVILSGQLRSDGLQVQVFSQEKNGKEGWKDAISNPILKRHFEESILLQARELKATAYAE